MTINDTRTSRLRLLTTLGALSAAAIVLGTACSAHDGRVGFGSSSTIRGSGARATQVRALQPFSAVELAGSNNVLVHVGGRQAVTVRGDDNLIRYVTTKVRGGELTIDDSHGFSTRSPMSVELTLPSLRSLELSGAGTLKVDGVRGRLLRIRVPGSGTIAVEGSVAREDVSLSGSGDLGLQRLVARDVSASLSGSGRIRVNVSRTLHATISGSGAISYAGDPAEVIRSVSGSGSIFHQ